MATIHLLLTTMWVGTRSNASHFFRKIADAVENVPTGLSTLLCAAGLFIDASAPAAGVSPEPGLVLTVTAGDQKDVSTAQNVSLHVEAGKSPTPFLLGGKFAAVWEGAIHADLRGNFSFQADLNGALKIEINGATRSKQGALAVHRL